MNVNVDITSIYGATLFKGTLPDFQHHQAATLEQIYKLYESEKGLNRSNLGGWQSNDKLFKSSEPEFKWLTAVLSDIGRSCIKKVEGDNITVDVNAVEEDVIPD